MAAYFSVIMTSINIKWMEYRIILAIVYQVVIIIKIVVLAAVVLSIISVDWKIPGTLIVHRPLLLFYIKYDNKKITMIIDLIATILLEMNQ